MCNEGCKMYRSVLKTALFAVAIVTLASAANATAEVVSVRLSELGFVDQTFSSGTDFQDVFATFGNFTVDVAGHADVAPPGLLFSDTTDTSRNARCTLGCTLTILVTSVGETAPAGFLSGFTNNLPSETPGTNVTVTEKTFWDPGDTAFAPTIALGSATFPTIGDTTQFTAGGQTSPYSLTEEFMITVTGPGNATNTSTIRISAVPEPSSLVMLGGGLLLIGSFVRKFVRG